MTTTLGYNRSRKVILDFVMMDEETAEKNSKKIERFFSNGKLGSGVATGRTTMKLRNFRKASLKKMHSEDQSLDLPNLPKKLRRIEKPVKKRIVKMAVLQPNKIADSSPQPISADVEMKEVDESIACESSNTMTLEQFTDIVLASEGMNNESAKNPEKLTPAITRLPDDEEQRILSKSSTPITENNNNNNKSTNNNIIIDLRHNEMVANILQNKDLTVEVKPLRVKPVVLSPRHPEGNYLYHHRPQQTRHPENSMVVSVQPRQERLPAQLPPGRPQSVPKMVEEWFKKMQPPICSPPPPPTTPSPVCLDPINLTVKTPNDPRSTPNPTESSGRATQIYLRPITTIQDPAKSNPAMDSISKTDRMSPQKFSSTQLEIKRVEGRSPESSNFKIVGRAFPFENTTYRDSVKARALRDIQLAHTKDMHGNFPIHMSVLMRKVDLVKRYCCVLQILDSSIDIVNEEQMTPLHLAIRDNSIEIVELLLAFGADPVIKDGGGNTGIHIAAATRATECLKLLVENVRNKEDLNEFNEYGITPLQMAMLSGDKIGSDILLRYGANPQLFDMKRDPSFKTGDKKTESVVSHQSLISLKHR